MRRSGTAAPLRMKDELPDPLSIDRTLDAMAKDVIAVEAGLARLAERMAELRKEQEPHRWTEDQS